MQNFKKIFLTLFIFSLKSFAIVGGVTMTDPLPSYLSEADRLEMKSHTVVLLNSQNSSKHSRCTGTLIDAHIILTAAHCVPDSLENLWVVPSIYEFAVLEQHPVVAKIVSADYRSFDIPKVNAPNNDIALIKFSGNLPAEYKPTTWITSFTPSENRFWLYVAGYGVSSEPAADSGELRFSKVTIENNLLNLSQSFMTGNQSNGEGICKGDSGGPAYIKKGNQFFVVGIVSAIAGSCAGTSYFNQTQFYNTWIQDNLDTLRRVSK